MNAYTPAPPQTLQQHESVQKKQKRVLERHEQDLKQAAQKRAEELAAKDGSQATPINSEIFSSTIEPAQGVEPHSDGFLPDSDGATPVILLIICVVGFAFVLKRQIF